MSGFSAIPAEECPSGGRHVFKLNHPHADIILRSCDSTEFRVPKVYIIDNSPVLADKIRSTSHPSKSDTAIPPDADAATCLPVVELSDSGVILSSLLSFIIPMVPDLPTTAEDILKLLSTAQKYEMSTVMTRIRDHLTRQKPPFIRDETAFHIYALAQKYGLRQEAVQAARLTLKFSMSIEDLEATGKLDNVSGALLHELWGYHQRVREYLSDDLTAFMMLGTGARINFRCIKLTSSDVPVWLNDYIDSIAIDPARFSLSEFHTTLMRHVTSAGSRFSRSCQSCASMASDRIDNFWTVFSDVVQRSIENAETDLLLESEMSSHYGHPNDSTSKVSPPCPSPAADSADVIVRSSDGVLFYVHKLILSVASPFFHDMFSLPQPADSELVDGLPVVPMPEDAEVLHNLITILYPVPSVVPDDYNKTLALLAVAQKYEMNAVQLSVRSEMKSKDLHPLTAAGAFRAYSFASARGLTPEMESAARLTLDFPMTFESMGDELAHFGGWALRDLVRFRKRCRDSLVSCLEALLDPRLPPSDIWVGCHNTTASFAWWLQTLLSEHKKKLQSTFTHSLLKPSSLRAEYLSALQSHVDQMNCAFCTKVHIKQGESFCVQVENKLTEALYEVQFNPKEAPSQQNVDK